MCERGSVWNLMREQGKFIRDRLPSLAATGQVIKSFLAEEFPGNEPILDLGTGIGILPQSCTDPALKKRLISLDVNPNPVRLAKKRNPGSTFLLADGYNLPFADGTFLYVTGLDFLNSEIPSIKEAGEEIHRVLRPGGKLIHFADTLPTLDPLFNEFKAKGLTPFPALDQQNRIAFTCVDLPLNKLKRRFDKYTIAQMFPHIPRKIIYEYVDMIIENIDNPQHYFDMILHTLNQNNDGGDIIRKNIQFIQKVLRILSISHDEPIALIEACGDHIVSALHKVGFQQVRKIYVTGVMTVPVQERKDLFPVGATGNYFINRAGNIIHEVRSDISKGHVQIESTVQVITSVS